MIMSRYITKSCYWNVMLWIMCKSFRIFNLDLVTQFARNSIFISLRQPTPLPLLTCPPHQCPTTYFTTYQLVTRIMSIIILWPAVRIYKEYTLHSGQLALLWGPIRPWGKTPFKITLLPQHYHSTLPYMVSILSRNMLLKLVIYQL